MLFTRILAIALVFAAGSAFAQVGNNTTVREANLVDKKELAGLPHMNDQLATVIIEKRPYRSMIEVDAALSGSLKAEQRTELYGRMFLPINLNTASEAEIMLIPGMTKRMAHEFEEYRPYTSLEQFRKEMRKYVDDKEVARLEQYVFIPMNLNTAPEAAFKTIPGMSDRMVHEFEEYRPYKDMGQFRKEIGKYVDQNEVARLERYVTLQ